MIGLLFIYEVKPVLTEDQTALLGASLLGGICYAGATGVFQDGQRPSALSVLPYQTDNFQTRLMDFFVKRDSENARTAEGLQSVLTGAVGTGLTVYALNELLVGQSASDSVFPFVVAIGFWLGTRVANCKTHEFIMGCTTAFGVGALGYGVRELAYTGVRLAGGIFRMPGRLFG